MKFRVIVMCVSVFMSIGFANDYTKVLEQFDRKNYQQVLDDLEGFTKKDGDWFKIRGTVFHELYVADSSVIYLKEAYDLGKKSDDMLILLAETLIWVEDYNSAQQILDLVKNKNKTNYLIVYAALQERKHNFSKSLKIYNKILKTNPDALDVLEKTGITYGWMKNFPKAIKSFTKIMNHPKASYIQKERALLKRAEVYAWSENKKEAYKDMNRLLKKNPENVDAMMLKAVWYEWEGDYKRAKRLCESVIQIAPENKAALNCLEKLSWVK